MEKELPSLIREKRLSDILDESGDDDETKENSQGGNNRFNIHATVNDGTSMSSHNPLYSHHRESQKKDKYQKSNEKHITRKNVRDASYRGQHTLRSDISRNLESQLLPKINENRHQETTSHSQLNGKQQDKVIVPGAKFGWLSQEVPRPPPPSEEMQHRMRIRMKHKKRRHLRYLKRISDSKTDKLQTDERTKTPGSSKTASVEQRLTSAQEESQTKTSKQKVQTTNPASSTLKSPETTKINSSLLSKPLNNSKKREALSDSYSPSSLKRPKRIPINDDNAATNRFSSLEITLKSKILSLYPEPSSSSKITRSSPSKKSSSTGISSSSIYEMPAADILSNFFQHAGSAGARTVERNRNLDQEDVKNPRNEIPNKSSRERETREKTRQEKRDQKGDDDYELKVLELQKKAIEEEEERLKEQLGPERQKIRVNKESRLEQLNQKTNEKEKEVQLLFEKFTKTDEQNTNNLKPSTIGQTPAKRSFGFNTNLANSDNDDNGVDGNDDGVGAIRTKTLQNRGGRRTKIPKSQDKGIIKKQRTINAGGDFGNDDEITEVAFYDKEDDITNQNKNIDGLKHSEKDDDGKELSGITEGKLFGTKDKVSLPTDSDSEASSTLMENGGIINKTKDVQSKISLLEPVKLQDGIDGKQTQNINENKTGESLEDEMENEDLMDSKQKQSREKSIRKVEVDIPQEQPQELQNNKYEKKDRNMENTNSTESTGKKGTDNADVDIDVVSDSQNPLIFTEIKEKEQEGSGSTTANNGTKERESHNTESIQEMAGNGDSESKMSDNNKDNSTSSGNSSGYSSGDSSNNDSSGKKHDDTSSSKQNMINEDDNDNIMLHDNRLMYILTGEGTKPPKQNRTKPSSNIKEMTNVKEDYKDRGANVLAHETERTHHDVKLNNEKPLVQRQIIINKGLKSKIKDMHNRILNAHNRVSQELEQMEQELSNKFRTLQESMSMAKTLTSNIDSKLNNSVLSVMKLASSSAKKAKTKLELVQSKYDISYADCIMLI